MHPHTLPMVQLTINDLVKCNILAAHSLACGMFTLWQCCFSEQRVRANQNNHFPQQREGCSLLGKQTQPVIYGQLAFPWHVHRIQNKFAQVRGLARSTVAVAVTQAGFPFQQQMTGMAYPALLHRGLLLLPVERGHKLTSKAKFLEEVAFSGTDRRRVHAATCTKCWVSTSLAWGGARTRHLFADPKQLPASWEETIPAHHSSVCALCPSQHK